MSKGMLGMLSLSAVQGPMDDLEQKLGGEDGLQWLEQLTRFLRKESTWSGESAVKVEAKNTASPTVLAGLLEEVGASVELAAIDRFVAREKLVVNRSKDAELPISSLGSCFEANFLDVIEENIAAAILKQHKLKKRSFDAPIFAALGDYDLAKIEKARVALGHTFTFLKTADRNRWFIFYVADAKGIVWAVSAFWVDDGWDIEASPVSSPNEWGTDSHVVSC